jgi:hypothetical protein
MDLDARADDLRRTILKTSRLIAFSAPRKASSRRMPCNAKQWTKPVEATQRVQIPSGKGKATSRKRVLRGERVTLAAKRRQRACGPQLPAPKSKKW